MTIDKELIDFINQEKIYKKINTKQVIVYFNKCIVKAFIDLDIKFIDLKNKNSNIISGTNMFYHIFLIYYNFSYFLSINNLNQISVLIICQI